jgi:hypothetical protein
MLFDPNSPLVNWWKLVWFLMHDFILSLVVRDSLSKVERMLKWAFKGDVFYVFCRSKMEGRGASLVSALFFPGVLYELAAVM